MTTEYSGSGDVSRSMELLWGLHERPSRGPKPALTLDQIVTAAVAVADTDGLDALSMRRVATELGVGTMSLYRYVPGKSELLDLMLDKVVEPQREFETAEKLGWRGVMEVVAHGVWQLYERHPWLLQVDQARPLLGPNSLTGVEFTVSGMAGTTLSDQQKVMVMTVVFGFVAGMARDYANALQAERRTGISDEDFWKAQEPVIDQVMRSGRYPTLAELAKDAFSADHEQTFEFGLERLLDGLEVYIGPVER